MTDPGPNSGADRDVDRDTPPGIPRWVKIAGLVIGLLIVIFVVLHVTGVAGKPGPGQHFSGEEPIPAGAPAAFLRTATSP